MHDQPNEDPPTSSVNPDTSPPESTDSNPAPPTTKARSEAQQRASRVNGSTSRGPLTAETKAVSKMNRTTHGGYASTVVIERGVLAEDPHAYELGLNAFLAAQKPLNAASHRFCVRMYNEIHKLDRMDCFEAIGIEDIGTVPDREYDKGLEEAHARHKLAELRVEDITDMLGEVRDNEPFDDYEWEQLLAFAEGIDPSLGELWEVIDNDETSAELGVDDDDEVDAAHRRIITVLQQAHGSLTAALEHYLSAAEDHEQLMAAALDSVEPPRSERERAARLAAYLIDKGFFDRLARPRTAAYRTLVAMNEMFLSSQELGPDEPPTGVDGATPDPGESDNPLPPSVEPGEPDTPDGAQDHNERGTNPSDTTTASLQDPAQAAVIAARQRIAEKEWLQLEHEQGAANTSVM